ncbi:tryptophan synthase subunit beta [Candidatus Margulisiibacteriota bacterium]
MKLNKYPYYDEFGGQFIPETLMPNIKELEKAFYRIVPSKKFQTRLNTLLSDYAGRPSPLFKAENLSKKYKNNIYLKREDLNHTGAHKINNTLGQVLLAQMMGKSEVIAETGAGQHGVATATAAALFKMKCKVFMGEIDIKRQYPNVFRMKMLGSEVIPALSGTKTLKDATNEAFRYWMQHPEIFYVIGSIVGPHPYPAMVKEFQSVIGKETLSQSKKQLKKLPDYILACVGGGSNAIGIFAPFIGNKKTEGSAKPRRSRTKLIGVEAAFGAPLAKGSQGVFHGALSKVMQTKSGQIQEAHSISAGLDYPGVGPEHSYLQKNKLAKYVTITDKEALKAAYELTKEEGILPALESAHALAYLPKLTRSIKGKNIIICLSGRGDKDMETLEKYHGKL